NRCISWKRRTYGSALGKDGFASVSCRFRRPCSRPRICSRDRLLDPSNKSTRIDGSATRQEFAGRGFVARINPAVAFVAQSDGYSARRREEELTAIDRHSSCHAEVLRDAVSASPDASGT